MESPGPPEAFAELPFYSAHFTDLVIWDTYVRMVAVRHGYTVRRISPGLPGTYPTFIVEIDCPLDQPGRQAIVVKFFGPLFEGADSFRVERAMGQFLPRQRLGIRSPAVLADGQLSRVWSYLILEHISGVSWGEARSALSRHSMELVAAQLGDYLKDLHSITANCRSEIPHAPSTWLGFLDFLDSQRATCLQHHRLWNDLPPHLLREIPDFILPIDQLLDLSSPPHLIHGDLTADHLLGRVLGAPSLRLATDLPAGKPAASTELRPTHAGEWQSLAIIDWSDCRAGNILYELVALHLDLFQADKNLLSLFLNAYGLPGFYLRDFAQKALSMVLLHQFPIPERISVDYQSVHDLSELADGLFGV